LTTIPNLFRISLLKPRPDFYATSHPLPSDVLLLVEVSHTTLRFDTKIKAPLYAEAGIAEYWVLNIPENVVEVRTEPANGRYTKLATFKPDGSVSPLAFPGITFRVEEILG
jgi:Uma2 family endonuclease